MSDLPMPKVRPSTLTEQAERVNRIRDLEARLAASEAGAAAMREALHAVKRPVPGGCCRVCGSDEDGCWPDCVVGKALASDAGRASCGYKYGWVPVLDETERTVALARAQALEDAAKVAEGDLPLPLPWADTKREHGANVARAIAAAIRALKEGT